MLKGINFNKIVTGILNDISFILILFTIVFNASFFGVHPDIASDKPWAVIIAVFIPLLLSSNCWLLSDKLHIRTYQDELKEANKMYSNRTIKDIDTLNIVRDKIIKSEKERRAQRAIEYDILNKEGKDELQD